MKWMKALCLMLAIAMLVAPCALAEGGSVAQLRDGDIVDLDGDGKDEPFGFVVTKGEDGIDSFTVTAGEAMGAQENCDNLTGEAYLMTLGNGDRYILVSEYGMSDDDGTYFYAYRDGVLFYAGFAGVSPKSVEIHERYFTADVRANILQTWFRPSDFIFAYGCYLTENGELTQKGPLVCECPRATYPLGTCVIVNRDLPLYKTMGGEKVVGTLPAGCSAILTATDDVEWVYAVGTLPANEDGYQETLSGWFHMADDFSVDVEGEAVPSGEMFNGLLFAD